MLSRDEIEQSVAAANEEMAVTLSRKMLRLFLLSATVHIYHLLVKCRQLSKCLSQPVVIVIIIVNEF